MEENLEHNLFVAKKFGREWLGLPTLQMSDSYRIKR